MGYFGIPFRNGVPIGLGSVASFGAQQFDPSSLFIGGTAGTWYDPSDPTTLFTTSAGTTPCAVPGSGSQVLVGQMLDKSQGAPGALGADVVTNGNFATDSNWTKGTGWTISGGSANYNGTGNNVLAQAGVFTSGKTYLITFDITVTSGGVSLWINGTQLVQANINITGSRTFRFFATTSGSMYFEGVAGASVLSLDNISVREIPGNHAIAFNDTTARPELSARVNLLTYSEQFDNGAWNKSQSTITSNSVVAPDGTATADKLVEDATNNQHVVFRSTSIVANTPYAVSGYFKAGERTRINFRLLNGTFNSGANVTFDLSAGTAPFSLLVGTATNLLFSITPVGNGWYRCAVSCVVDTTSTTGVWAAYLVNTGNNDIYLGDGTSGVFIWGADLRPANIGSAIPSYQRIADQYTYDSNGFPSYLRFDGVDDSMYTPGSIPFATVTSDGLARRNLLSNPTQFDAAGWTKNAPPYPIVTANTDLAPDGTITMDTLAGEAGLTRYLQQTVSVSASTTYAVSIYIKSGTSTRSVLRVYDSGLTTLLAGLNIDWSGTVPAVGTTSGTWVIGPTITAAENGTYRVVGAFSSGANASVAYLFYPDNSVTGSGTVKTWGAQLETGSTATAFQNIGTDKMSVFAGVRKLSDAARGMLAELGNIPGANTFRIEAPPAAVAAYTIVAGGSALVSLQSTASFSAPISNVATGISDIAADSLRLRLNASEQTPASGDQGTGNFGTYPLYIGSRANTSLFFNGHLYSLITAGTQLQSGSITATEQYVAEKTGITI